MAREAYQGWRIPVGPWDRANKTKGSCALAPLSGPQETALKALHALAADPQDPFPSAARNALRVVLEAIPFDAAWVVRCAPDTHVTVDGYLHQLPEGLLAPLLTPSAPLLQPFHEQGSIALRGSDLNETEYWLNGSFYLEKIVPLGLIYPLASLCIDEAGGEVGMLTLWRSKGRSDFSPRESHFLERASTLLGALFRYARSSSPEPEIPAWMAGIGRHDAPGVLVLGEEGEFLFMNESAAALLNGLRGGTGNVPRLEEGRVLRQLQQLKRRVFRAVSEKPAQIGTLPICDLLSLRGKRFSLRGIALEGGGRKQMTVMILIEPVEEKSGSTGSGRPDFGLTEREESISRLIGQGLTNKEIASELGIGVYTVKDHIKNILKKVQSSTRAGLVAKLMGGPGRTA
ncbi:MAG: response regulator transcription factor [Nitrospirae bacterium]|nr:response regulator transcription factor [Candidatus Manganitrophaceae bacterium]